MDITARALLVNTTVRVWTGEKRDRAITREICDLKGAEQDAVRANKSLLGEAIKPVQIAERSVRAAVNAPTLPWLDGGTRILKGSAFLAFTESLAEPIRGFDAAVDTFIAAYPEIDRKPAGGSARPMRTATSPPRRSSVTASASSLPTCRSRAATTSASSSLPTRSRPSAATPRTRCATR